MVGSTVFSEGQWPGFFHFFLWVLELIILLSTAGQYALLPLVHQPAEWALARFLLLSHGCATLHVLRGRRAHSSRKTGEAGLLDGGLLRSWELLYVLGLLPLDLFCSLLHPLALAPRMPFLPLMATSVYCALGVLHATALVYGMWAAVLDDNERVKKA